MHPTTPKKDDMNNISFPISPMPLACSTVQRRGVPSRPMDDSDLSSTSSLGILNMDKLDTDMYHSPPCDTTKDDLNCKPAMTASERLKLQTKLALQTLDNANNSRIPPKHEPPVSISYLLRPTAGLAEFKTRQYNESSMLSDMAPMTRTINLDDEMSGSYRALNDDLNSSELSMSMREILAASAFKDVQDSLCDVTESGTSRDIWDAISPSPKVDFNRLVQPLSVKDAVFTPAEMVEDKLNSDEILWRQDYDDIPPQTVPGPERNIAPALNKSTEFLNMDKIRMEFSCFSGYLPKDDLSVTDSNTSKTSVSNFFQKRSHNLKEVITAKSPRRESTIPLTETSYSSPGVPESTYQAPGYQIPTKQAAMVPTQVAITPVAKSNTEQNLMSLSTVWRAIDAFSPTTFADKLCTVEVHQKQECAINTEWPDQALKSEQRSVRPRSDSFITGNLSSGCTDKLSLVISDEVFETPNNLHSSTINSISSNEDGHNKENQIGSVHKSTTKSLSEVLQVQSQKLRHKTQKIINRSKSPLKDKNIQLATTLPKYGSSVIGQTDSDPIEQYVHDPNFNKITFKGDTMYPLLLSAGETKPLFVKNIGDNELLYTVHIGNSEDDTTLCNQGHFVIDSTVISLLPDKESIIYITFNPKMKEDCDRAIILTSMLNGEVVTWAIKGVCETHSQSVSTVGQANNQNQSAQLSLSPTNILREELKKSPIAHSTKQHLSPTYQPPQADMVTKSPNFRSRPASLCPSSHICDSALQSCQVSSAGSRPVSPPGVYQIRSPSQNSQHSSEGSRPVSPTALLPIKATMSEMSWASLKIGKRKTQDVTIKNTSYHRLRLQITVTGDGFKLVKDRDFTSGTIVTLQGLEVRKLGVVFAPTATGAYSGTLAMSYAKSKISDTRLLPLWGYGGHCNVSVTGVFRAPNGTQFLSLGELGEPNPLTKRITLFNDGTLPAFAMLKIDSKFRLMRTEIDVSPDTVFIQPNRSKNITVSFLPQRNWLENVEGNVIGLGNICITTGDEATRQRISKLYNSQRNISDSKWKHMKSLCKTFEQESVISDIGVMKESRDALNEIYVAVKICEVGLTVERSVLSSAADFTLSAAENSLLFLTLCSANTSLANKEISVNSTSQQKNWRIEPESVLLNETNYICGSVTVYSYCTERQCYEIKLEEESPLEVSPMEGCISVAEPVLLSVRCKQHQMKQAKACGFRNIKLTIEMMLENEIISIPVEIQL